MGKDIRKTSSILFPSPPQKNQNPSSIMEKKPKRIRNICSQYRALDSRIIEEQDDIIANVDSDKFTIIMSQVEGLHHYVHTTKEQVADASTLLGLSNALVTSVKTHMGSGITPTQFVSSLIGEFGKGKRLSSSSAIRWEDIGSVAVPLFINVPGCMTMIGPMCTKLQQWKRVVIGTLPGLRPRQRWRSRTTGARAYPKVLQKSVEVVTETNMIVRVMFELLKKRKKVKVENLILNRSSFAQTVENLFALSFLVKDGRVLINVDDNGSQLVVPSNGPRAGEIKSGAARSYHFIFQFNFKEWKAMKDLIQEGEEVMPTRHAYSDAIRNVTVCKHFSEEEDAIPVAIPLRKFSRNYGHAGAKSSS